MTNQEIWNEEERKWRLTWNANEEDLSARHKQERFDFRANKRASWGVMRLEIHRRQKLENGKDKTKRRDKGTDDKKGKVIDI